MHVAVQVAAAACWGFELDSAKCLKGAGAAAADGERTRSFPEMVMADLLKAGKLHCAHYVLLWLPLHVAPSCRPAGGGSVHAHQQHPSGVGFCCNGWLARPPLPSANNTPVHVLGGLVPERPAQAGGAHQPEQHACGEQWAGNDSVWLSQLKGSVGMLQSLPVAPFNPLHDFPPPFPHAPLTFPVPLTTHLCRESASWTRDPTLRMPSQASSWTTWSSQQVLWSW